ncbi:MAG: hypothetical protein OSA11_02310 [Candidatus Nanopelagicales bacterium]|nr:hypothetical protein [Candidatus Nanopelagicales bacterium]
MGSIKNSLFAQYLLDSMEGPRVKDQYDIVLISQFRTALLTSAPSQGLVEYEKTVRLLHSYLESHVGLRVSVAMFTASDDPNHDAEVLFHQERLGSLATLTPMSEDWMLSYHLTEQSKVVVSAYSTLAIESLARGRKALMCSSLYSEKFLDQPFTPDWTLLRMDQETFDEAATKLLAMPREDFLLRNSKSINYVMISPRENSTSEFIKEVFDQRPVH